MNYAATFSLNAGGSISYRFPADSRFDALFIAKDKARADGYNLFNSRMTDLRPLRDNDEQDEMIRIAGFPNKETV